MSRGGKRDGAGRPTKDGIARKRLTVAIREDILAELMHQAEAQGCSLADRLNALLALQLKPRLTSQSAEPAQPGPPFVTSSGPAAQTPAEPFQGDSQALYAQLLKQVDAFDRHLAALPLDEAEPVPTHKELLQLLARWTDGSTHRRSKEIQYWRKHYRQDGTFRKAMDHLAAWTHERFRELLLDNRLPLATHDEALALSVLPAKALKLTAARLLKGERDLKRALQGSEESFRQAVTQHRTETDPSRSAYRFESEL